MSRGIYVFYTYSEISVGSFVIYLVFPKNEEIQERVWVLL
nr:MAG TPA: hypothetical protein [Caudoviricetes sp.]